MITLGVFVTTEIAEADQRPTVYASNYPLYFFASELAGDAADVRLPKIDGDPAFWTPTGEQVMALQAADLVILNGAGYEAWLNYVSLREERLVDTTKGLEDRLLPLEEATVHQHGPEGEHSHAGTAFTTWLDPFLASLQARAVAAALSALMPEARPEIEARLSRLVGRLQALDRDLEQTFSALGDEAVVFSHPVYQYLQNRYGIRGRSVHWEPNVAPGTRDWIEFHNLLAEHPAQLLVWESEPIAESRGQLAALGIHSVVFDPGGNRPENTDYFGLMERNRQALLAVRKQ